MQQPLRYRSHFPPPTANTKSVPNSMDFFTASLANESLGFGFTPPTVIYIQDRLLLMKQLPHQVIRFLQHFLHHRQRILGAFGFFASSPACFCVSFPKMILVGVYWVNPCISLILHLPINRGKGLCVTD